MLGAALTALAAAAQPRAPVDADDAGLEVTGLLFDRTKTKGGRDFFEAFQMRWEDVEGVRYSITVREQPLLGRSSAIHVDLDDVTVFRARLNPRRAWIDAAAAQAVATVAARLLEQSLTGTPATEVWRY